MNQLQLTRNQILSKLNKVYEPEAYIHAVWEAGSAAFDRIDEWSDIDLHVVVEDDHVEDVFQITEAALEKLSTIDLIFEVPQPTWHGHAQKFYRLKDAPEYLQVDLAVMKFSNQNRFLEAELHGEAQILFDRSGVVNSLPLDRDELKRKLAVRLVSMRNQFDMFQILVRKEVYRRQAIDALAYYHALTIRPLVELLRIKYQPERYQFSLRYLYYDLPEEIAKRIEKLVFVRDIDDILVKQAEAEKWFFEIWDSLQEV